MMSIVSIVLVETRRNLRTIAIMASLGASGYRIAESVCAGVVSGVASGALLAALLLMAAYPALRESFLGGAAGPGLDVLWPVPVLTLLAIAGSMALVGRVLGKVSIQQQLRSE